MLFLALAAGEQVDPERPLRELPDLTHLGLNLYWGEVRSGEGSHSPCIRDCGYQLRARRAAAHRGQDDGIIHPKFTQKPAVQSRHQGSRWTSTSEGRRLIFGLPDTDTPYGLASSMRKEQEDCRCDLQCKHKACDDKKHPDQEDSKRDLMYRFAHRTPPNTNCSF